MSDPTYRLLLELAGRVDDDLLATGRELVAVGEEGHALELLVAELVAGRVVLPPAVRLDLVTEAGARRVQPDADRGLPRGELSGDGGTHRFTPDGPADRTGALARALVEGIAPDGGWTLAWRVTPAGAAPGPLPHPVLLGRAAGEGAAEVLTFQAQSALARAGLAASVEVRGDGDPDTAYHRAAREVAQPLPATDPAPADGPTGALRAGGPGDRAVGPASGRPGIEVPEPAPGTEPTPGTGAGAVPDGAAVDDGRDDDTDDRVATPAGRDQVAVGLAPAAPGRPDSGGLDSDRPHRPDLPRRGAADRDHGTGPETLGAGPAGAVPVGAVPVDAAQDDAAQDDAALTDTAPIDTASDDPVPGEADPVDPASVGDAPDPSPTAREAGADPDVTGRAGPPATAPADRSTPDTTGHGGSASSTSAPTHRGRTAGSAPDADGRPGSTDPEDPRSGPRPTGGLPSGAGPAPEPSAFAPAGPGSGGHRPGPGPRAVDTVPGPVPPADAVTAEHPAPRPSPPIRALRRATAGDWFDADDQPGDAASGTAAIPAAGGSASGTRPETGPSTARTGDRGAAPDRSPVPEHRTAGGGNPFPLSNGAVLGADPPGAVGPGADRIGPGATATPVDPGEVPVNGVPATVPLDRPAAPDGPAAPDRPDGATHANRPGGRAPVGPPAAPAADEDTWLQDWASGSWVGDLSTTDPGGQTGPVPTVEGAEIDAPTPPPGVPIAYAPPVPTSSTRPDEPRRPRHLLSTEDVDAAPNEHSGVVPSESGGVPDPHTGAAPGQGGHAAPNGRAGAAPDHPDDAAPSGRGDAVPDHRDHPAPNAHDHAVPDHRDGPDHRATAGPTGDDTAAPDGRNGAGRPSPQPRPGGGLVDRLSPTEQDLLQRLHEELAARESGGEPTPRNGTARTDRA